MKVRKAVIPAAGVGTRMLPISSVVPKELLPVNGRPVIEHVVREAVEAGIDEVILVISKGKEAVASYFDADRELETLLLNNGKLEELRLLEEVWDLVKISVIFQNEQLGLGHAVLCAKDAVGDEPFAVLLGDTIVEPFDGPAFTTQLVDAFRNYERSVVGVQEVDECRISKYGIFEGAEFEEGVYHGKNVVEKPDPSQTDSNLAFCARYVFTPRIFHHLEQTGKGVNGEIQLTDAMQSLLQENGLNAVKLDGERFDIGDPNGLLLANLSLTELGCPE